jgi:hypothetical protein
VVLEVVGETRTRSFYDEASYIKELAVCPNSRGRVMGDGRPSRSPSCRSNPALCSLLAIQVTQSLPEIGSRSPQLPP